MPEVNQSELFHATIFDAIREMVRALGGSKKAGKLLRPEKLPDDAGRWLDNCLNPECRDKLDLEQLQLLLREARKVGCHAAVNFICADAGYSAPQPIEPEDEKAQLQREFIAAIAQQTRNIERMERLSAPSGNLRVASA